MTSPTRLKNHQKLIHNIKNFELSPAAPLENYSINDHFEQFDHRPFKSCYIRPVI